MKLIDITSKDLFVEALENAMCLATGFMSDNEIIALLRNTASRVDAGVNVEYSALVAFDSDDLKSRAYIESYILALSAHAPTFISRLRVVSILEQQADDYEEEIA